jgi:hypothetical protein
LTSRIAAKAAVDCFIGMAQVMPPVRADPLRTTGFVLQ